MRAIGVQQPGGPEQLIVLDVPEPAPGPGEIRIAVRAAGVNPTDTGVREGKSVGDLQPPYIPGMDAAGVIDAIGPGVELSVGDRVAAVVDPRRPAGGAYAELVVVPQESVAMIPDGMDFVAAATLPLNTLTARRALQLVDLPDGGTVAITGAAGAVGGFAIELAGTPASARSPTRRTTTASSSSRSAPTGCCRAAMASRERCAKPSRAVSTG